MNSTNEPFATRFFILPIFSGIFLALTLPWFELSFFVWVALIPLFIFISKPDTSPTRAFQGGLITGVVYFSTVVYPLFSLKAWWWLDVQDIVYENKILLLFWILYAGVLVGGILFGIFARIFKKIHQEGFVSVFILSVVWVFFEYVRAKILFGFTWGHLGYALHDSLPLMQAARFGGVYMVSFFVVLVNILLYYTIHRPRKDIEGVEGHAKAMLYIRSIGKHWYPYGVMFIMAVLIFGGNFLLNISKSESLKHLPIAIIQPGRSENREGREEETFQMIEQSLARGPMIIVVPESSFPSIVIDEDTMQTVLPSSPMGMMRPQASNFYIKLKDISKAYQATSFVVGVKTQRGVLHYNSMITVEGGEVTSIYHKRILFPFSERSISWFPFKNPEPLTAGEKNSGLIVQGEPVAALICSESLFSNLVKDADARFIIAVGNDGVFQSARVALYNHIIAKFMAVETGKYVVRAMETGVSSIITPTGTLALISDGENKGIFFGEVVLDEEEF